ncbi:hypothetical protein PTQ33_06820 [Campylobacter sp. 50012-21]|uniref:hypothetical protein n=1 Tax=Campylobacter magnus TaxID=3026462 RepID=UPI002362D752|nr:hypothetical protein [Campylobacter magnus]MDD0846838.1 hypothetical protein [Campylobacter magnus]
MIKNLFSFYNPYVLFKNSAGGALALIAPALRLDELCILSSAQIRHTKGKCRTFFIGILEF